MRIPLERNSLDPMKAHVTCLLQGVRYHLLTDLDPAIFLDGVYHLLHAPDALISSLEAIYCSDCCSDLLPLDCLLCFQRFDVICVGLELGNNLPNEYRGDTETDSSLLVAELL